jgi:alkylation response protein AidB-like acyl-CoA dehydrogenase
MTTDLAVRIPAEVLAGLAAHADGADTEAAWPAESWELLRRSGALGWAVPRKFGGLGLDRIAQLDSSEQLASACLTTAFIFSQREAALRWLLEAPSAVQQQYLPALARGEYFVTVGISQLTTSRQHRPPSLRARPLGSDDHPTVYRIDGLIPWVTGADQATAVIAGAALEDGRQIVFMLPRSEPGVTVDPPLRLASLAGSRTAQIHCTAVEAPADRVLAGPASQLVRSGGGLETSCLALGLARAAVAALDQEASRRVEAGPPAARLRQALDTARQRLHELAAGSPSVDDILGLRVICTRLALRATQASLAVAKGTGFLVPHPAQRWAGQALFFLVWSCPLPAAAGLLADLAAIEG